MIAAAAGISHPLPGQSLFTLAEDAVRTRAYGAFVWSPNSSEYVKPITRYSVSGPVWLDASWKRESILPPPGEPAAASDAGTGGRTR